MHLELTELQMDEVREILEEEEFVTEDLPRTVAYILEQGKEKVDE